MHRLLTSITALTFLLTLSTTTAFAIDADMWENLFRVRLGMEKGMTATKMIESVLDEDVFKNKKDAKIVVDKVSNTATVTLKKPYKDITSIRANQKTKNGTTSFSLTYTFANDKMLLLDILGRYGNICEVETDAEMGRLISFFLNNKTELRSDHPLNLLVTGLEKKEYIAMRFTSPDRVYVTQLMYIFGKNDDTPEGNNDASSDIPDAAPAAK
jgi:hypothetical protein